MHCECNVKVQGHVNVTVVVNVQSEVKTVDNGVNVEALMGARAALTETPAAGQFTWRAACEWVDGAHSRSTIDGFFGLGAYVTAVLSASYGWPVYLSMPAALVVVAILAFVIARPILRLSGHYLAMATLGLGILISIVLRTEAGITGGPDGMMAPPLSIAGTDLYDERYWYALIAVLLVITVWLALNLIDSPVGRALRAVHGSEVAAEVVGVHTLGYKVLIFVVSAVLAGLAGVLTAHYAGFVTPDLANFIYSIEFVTMVVLGGMASTYGALIGALILTLLPQFLTGVDELEMMILGFILMVVVIFMPTGLVPTLGRLLPGGRR